MIVCLKSTDSAWWIPVSHFIWMCSFSLMNPVSFEAPLKYNNALYAEKLSKRVPLQNSASGVRLLFSSRLTLRRAVYLFSAVIREQCTKANFGHRALTFVCCHRGAVSFSWASVLTSGLFSCFKPGCREAVFYRFSFQCPTLGYVTAPQRLSEAVSVQWQFAIPLGHLKAFTNVKVCILGINRNISSDLSRTGAAAT